MNKKIVNQIERTLKHCNNTHEMYRSTDDESREDCTDYYINQGWVEALEFVLKAIKNGSPVSDAPLDTDDFDDKHRTTVEVEAKIKGDE